MKTPLFARALLLNSLLITTLAVCASTIAQASDTPAPGTTAPTSPTQGAAAPSGDIPTTEKEFIASINSFEKTKILAQFGEPSAKNEFKKESGEVIASVWQYHNLNKAVDGAYYQTTELDFIGDKVVMVVFMNNDGSDMPNGAVVAPPVPAIKPDM